MVMGVVNLLESHHLKCIVTNVHQFSLTLNLNY